MVAALQFLDAGGIVLVVLDELAQAYKGACAIAPSWRSSSIPARAPAPSSGAATSITPVTNGCCASLKKGESRGKSPFQSALKKQRKLSGRAIHVNDICRMMKRKLKDIGLPQIYSPHSFRVTIITDLLEQGVPLEDVQRLAGHADPRTTGLYDRRKRKIRRNIVERISI